MTTPIFKARQTIGMLQKDLAEKAGIDQGHMSRIERGVSKPSPEVASRIVKVMRGTVTEMELLYPERYKVKRSKP